jgi:hypothetical protein
VATCIAVGAHEALSENATLQEGAKFLLDIAGQTAIVIFSRIRQEGFEVLPHELIQNGLRGPARKVRAGKRRHEGPRSRFAGVRAKVRPL